MSKIRYQPKWLTVTIVLTVLAVLLWPATRPLMAQEQQAAEIQQISGPYDIGVLTERSNLSVGRARFIITVADQASGEPVTGAQILIHIKYQAAGTEGWAAAYSIPKFPGTYNAQARFDSPGFYLISVGIEGPLGDGTVLLEPLHVPDVRGFSSGSFVFIGLSLVLVAGAAYVWWSASREKKRRESLAVPPGASTDGPAEQGHEGPGSGG